MKKVFGTKECFIPIREEETRIVISYDYAEEPDGVNATWWELYYNKVDKKSVGFNEIKDAILKDIDARTDYRNENDLVWTSFDGEQIPVKLDAENKFNFKASYDLAVQQQGATLPVTFKMSEKEVRIESEEKGGIPTWEKQPVYHTFTTMEEATDFYMKAMAFIQGCYQEGWQKKDNFDWTPYQSVTV
ncbi:MAG: hypothetical protein J6I61_03820 [Prevotella sp.]|nr:hypothetical protein [Prevotella sp.]